jgi:SAM-dependent methyltransferase
MAGQSARTAPGETTGIYMHGHARLMTPALAERSAEREGAFYLPHGQPGMRLLDVGCGPGSITIGFARVDTPGAVVGIDREPTAVDAVRALASDQHLANLRFEVGTAEAVPFPDARFTAAFAHTLLGQSRGARDEGRECVTCDGAPTTGAGMPRQRR